jgi:hypothetical protein
MPPIFPQMHRNPVCTAHFREYSRRHWIGFNRAASLPNCGNVIDINAECRQS